MRENMDVDSSDVDQNLLQQFSCMVTSDREELISEMQTLVGNQIGRHTCAFFLDMNNWNLQGALCSYYDFNSPSAKLPSMSFVADITIGEGESVCPNTKFLKTWRVKNSGDDAWPASCFLKFVHGDQFGHNNEFLIDQQLLSNQSMDISVEMTSPAKPGIYQGQWRMQTPNGYFFGDVIWVILTVSETGVLGLTQQMSSLNELGSPPKNSVLMQQNPFGSLPNYNNVSVSSPEVTNHCSAQPVATESHIQTNNFIAEESIGTNPDLDEFMS